MSKIKHFLRAANPLPILRATDTLEKHPSRENLKHLENVIAKYIMSIEALGGTSDDVPSAMRELFARAQAAHDAAVTAILLTDRMMLGIAFNPRPLDAMQMAFAPASTVRIVELKLDDELDATAEDIADHAATARWS